MKRNPIKQLIEKYTGYWIYKTAYLPIGSDLRIDITKKLNYKKLLTIFDVGANIGQTYNRFRKDFPGSIIYCFEPILGTFNKLRHNIGHKPNVKLENLALGEKAGQKKIKLFSDWDVLNSLRDDIMNEHENAEEEIVNIDTLDAYCQANSITKIDLLKIDTEGYELNVIEGAKELISRGSISLLFCEVGFITKDNRHTNFSELSEMLALKNYYFYGIYDLNDQDWLSGNSYGNALYAHSSVMYNR